MEMREKQYKQTIREKDDLIVQERDEMLKYKKRLDVLQMEHDNLKISRESEIRKLESEKYDLLYKLDE